MKKAIVVIHGGLGNQLFQYSFAIALKRKHQNLNVTFDLSFFENKNVLYPRKFMLYDFNIPFEVVEIKNFILHPNLITKLFKLLNRRFFINLNNSFFSQIIYSFYCLLGNIITEIHQFGFKSSFLSGFYYLTFNTRIYNGYWSDYRYFASIIDFLKNGISIKNPSDLFLKLVSDVKSNDILIHIRRGDYLNIDNGNDKPSGEGIFLGFNYYELQIAKFIDSTFFTSNTVFWIFTDDYEWSKVIFSSKFNGLSFNFLPSNLTDSESFELMRSFSNKIYANSTYSLWSHYLSYKKTDFVVFPDNWLKQQKILGFQLFP